MARDGGGIYSIPGGSVFANATVIDEVVMNALITDIESDLNVDRPVVAGGTGASTVAEARTNLGIKTALKGIDTTGSSNAYLFATSDSLTPTNGDTIVFVASFANTGAATLNVDATGNKDIKKVVRGTVTALVTGDIFSNSVYVLTYDSSATAWLIVNREFTLVTGSTTGVTGSDVLLVTGTAGTTNFTAKWDANGDLIDGFEVLDEDDMSSDSATKLSTQQAIKAYADTKSSGITRYSAIATPSGTTHDFTSIPAGTNRITVMLDEVSLRANDELLLQIGDAGGIEASNYASGSGNSDGSTVSRTAKTDGFVIFSNNAARIAQGIIELNRMDGNKWVSSHVVSHSGAGAESFGGGQKTLSAELDRIQITRSGSNTFDAGSISIFTEV